MEMFRSPQRLSRSIFLNGVVMNCQLDWGTTWGIVSFGAPEKLLLLAMRLEFQSSDAADVPGEFVTKQEEFVVFVPTNKSQAWFVWAACHNSWHAELKKQCVQCPYCITDVLVPACQSYIFSFHLFQGSFWNAWNGSPWFQVLFGTSNDSSFYCNYI